MECILSQGQGGGRGTGTSDILKGKWKEAENDRKGEREGGVLWGDLSLG